ncbi:MAG: hypothetical protein IKF82_00345 [Bacilli bacterium]|nr:hypothetical protein [Bacilli bacterium]
MSNKIKIRCKVKNCDECEMCRFNWPITFIHQCGLDEKRETLVGFKCTRYGHCAETKEQLHKGGYIDDLIFIE